MNLRDVRILIDECIPTPIFTRLVDFMSPNEIDGPVIRHLFDFVESGTLDEDWTPQFKDGGWTVLSADHGRKPKKNTGKKLPQLCIDYGITLILLSPAVHNRKVFDKAKTIISVWDTIIEIAADPSKRGSRYMIEPQGQDNSAVGRITERPLKPPSSEVRRSD